MVCLMRIHALPLRMEIAGAVQWQDVHCVLKGTHFEASNELNSDSSRAIFHRRGNQRYSINDILVTEVPKVYVVNLLESKLDNAVLDKLEVNLSR